MLGTLAASTGPLAAAFGAVDSLLFDSAVALSHIQEPCDGGFASMLSHYLLGQGLL